MLFFFNLWIKPHEKMLVGILFCHLIWKAETIWCNDQNGVWFPPGRWAVGRVLREWTWPDIVVSFDKRPFIKQQSLVRDLDLSALIEPLMFKFHHRLKSHRLFVLLFSSWILNVAKDVLHIIECNHRQGNISFVCKIKLLRQTARKNWDYHAKSVIFSV